MEKVEETRGSTTRGVIPKPPRFRQRGEGSGAQLSEAAQRFAVWFLISYQGTARLQAAAQSAAFDSYQGTPLGVPLNRNNNELRL
jgi:hypothetical protein